MYYFINIQPLMTFKVVDEKLDSSFVDFDADPKQKHQPRFTSRDFRRQARASRVNLGRR